jgi:DNA-directed RNA polymerase subunit omega
MRIVNKDVEEGETKIVNSRYSIVLATSKRARQIIDGRTPLVKAKAGEKPLSVAIDELYSEQLKIIAENSEGDFDLEALMKEYMAKENLAKSSLVEEELKADLDVDIEADIDEDGNMDIEVDTDIDVDSLIEEYTEE